MAQDIIDAEFVSLQPPDTPREQPAGSDRSPPDEQIGILKRKGGSAVRRRLPVWMMAIALSFVATAFVAAGIFLAGAGTPVSDSARALELVDISDEQAAERGNVVTVSASIRNRSSEPRVVPDILLTFTAASGDGNLVYRVPRGETLKPGKSLAFTVRMPKKAGYGAPRLGFSFHGA